MIEQVLAGDTEAFRTIIDHYEAYLYQVALSVLHHPKDAEDAAQEAFVKIYFSLSKYQGQGFKTWLTRIVVHTAIDYKRKLGTRRETLGAMDSNELAAAAFEQTAAPESVEDDLLRKERAQLIACYLSEIPDNYRHVVVAFYMEEKSHMQIASEHGIAVKTVESKLYRARTWMKKHWKEEDFR
ncbi:RNA polymerase sigma factor SigW [Paenibacillus baekrokdamisoli]|uniref:RNA polymerase sigma factor SigW n=1 Tax=Paenibacillus baekrokdamisoli TaxID=1712516 RepID=A0A3G9J2U6_9BACL|nr:sigma-70 family RNA polymerase sigma factor [Paenibacillus baekrokdamisoli]MBB3068293.1 RNA polymerase sigma factor (sigma-70 family) [Paenibacillus baekrokdamisoli]BBH22665.1 RNA polymerase sigma factor SigW [Paenibacillus baekrokdamisoli]